MKTLIQIILDFTLNRGSLMTLLLAGCLAATAQGASVFTTTGSLGTARYGHTSTLLPNGKVLVAAGQRYYQGGEGGTFTETLNSAELYDPASGLWSSGGSLATARDRHTATLLPNGKVLVAGGGTNSAELYNPATGLWSATGSLGTARRSATATLLTNGKVLVVGGSDSNGAILKRGAVRPGHRHLVGHRQSRHRAPGCHGHAANQRQGARRGG